MALVPYTITALAESDAQGTDGKNIVAGATCSVYSQPSDSVVTLYDDAAGSNGSTSKVTGANGQVVVYVEPGSYRVSVNAVDSYTLVGAEKQTTQELINSTRTYQTGDTITTTGFTTAGDGGGAQWLATATTGQTPSQTPAQLGNAELVDASGRVWEFAGNDINISQAGAIGDYLTDSSSEVLAAIDNPYVFVPSGNFLLNSTIETAQSATQIYGARVPNVGRSGRDSMMYCNHTDAQGILVSNSNTTLSSFTLSRDVVTGPDIGIYCPQPGSATTPSRDVFVDNMQINYFPTCLRVEGRGVDFKGCVIASTDVVVDLDWGVGFEDVRENTHGTQGGFRNFNISGLRVHTVETAVVQNIGNNRKWISAINISDITVDIGSALFKGVLRRGSLTDCVVNLARASTTGIDLWGDSESYAIDNIVYCGSFYPENGYEIVRSLPNYLMIMRGSQRKGAIGNLVVDHIDRQAIRLESDAIIDDVRIERLTARNVAIDNPAFGVMTAVSGASGELRFGTIEVDCDITPSSPIPIFTGNSGISYIVDNEIKYDSAKYTLKSGSCRVYMPFTVRVASDGTKEQGSDFLTTSKTSTGVYEITHNMGIASATEAVAIANCVSNGAKFSSIALTSDAITVRTFNSSGAPEDSAILVNFSTIKN